MALTLVLETGAGLANANSYATAAEGDSYHDAHLYATDWTGATSSTKETALVWATRLLDEQIDWAGAKQSREQALAWPRVGVVDCEGHSIDSDQVPAKVKNACAEMARYLIGENRTLENDTRGIAFMGAGSLQITPNVSDRKGVLPDSVIAIVQGACFGTVHGTGGAGMGFAKLLRT